MHYPVMTEQPVAARPLGGAGMNTSPAVSASSPFDNPSRFGGRAPDIAGAIDLSDRHLNDRHVIGRDFP